MEKKIIKIGYDKERKSLTEAFFAEIGNLRLSFPKLRLLRLNALPTWNSEAK